MGFDWELVEGEATEIKSYFQCAICLQLVDINAAVTIQCSHCFCCSCLEEWCIRSVHKDKNAGCPTCMSDLFTDRSASKEDLLVFDEKAILARSIHKSSGLLARMLKGVVVQCPMRACTWKGSYGDCAEHLQNKTLHASTTAPVLPSPPSNHEFKHPLCIAVTGAGSTEVNGVFHYSGMYKDFPSFQMNSQFMGEPVCLMVHIQRLKSGNKLWFISFLDSKTRKANPKEKSLYRGPYVLVAPQIPQRTGWRSLAKYEIGKEPGPALCFIWK